MRKDFENKVVWITGASSGIGEALSEAFAKAGARLILSARREAELARVKANLALPEKDCLLLPLDLEHPDSFPELVSRAIEHMGTVDIVVHNGGISQRSYVKDSPLSIDHKLMNTNYFGAVALTKAILPYFIAQQQGHFVVISSLVGIFGTPLRSAYAASKHALHGFFDSLRAEVQRDHIWVTLVCPGYIRTHISLNAVTKTGEKHNQMDSNQQKGMLPAVCAQKILAAVTRKKQEVLIGGKETWGVYLKRFAPRLLARLVSRLNRT